MYIRGRNTPNMHECTIIYINMYIRDSNSLQRSSGQYDEWPEIWIVWDRNHLWYACKFVELCSLLEILTTVCLLPLPSLNWFIYLSLRQSISLLIYRSLFQSICLLIYPIYVYIYLYIYLSIILSKSLSFSLSLVASHLVYLITNFIIWKIKS